VTSLGLLSKYLLIMELRFDPMLYSNLGNEHYDAGHIKSSRGSQVLHPWYKQYDDKVLQCWCSSPRFGGCQFQRTTQSTSASAGLSTKHC